MSIIWSLPGDVADREGMVLAAEKIADWGEGLHVLCNNAGLNVPKRSWAELDWPSWDKVIEVNITGALNVIAACLPIMRAQKDGVLIHTSSWAGSLSLFSGWGWPMVLPSMPFQTFLPA